MESPKINRGIFSFLVRRGCNIHDMRRILSLYALQIEIKRPKKARLEWYSEISEKAQTDFAEFKKCYNKNKSLITIRQTYDDWWNECNLDGSFAYNGCTDDF